MRSNFYIYCAKFLDLSNRAVDYFIKSWKYKPDSDEWVICRAKERIFNKEALKYLKKTRKELGGQV